MRWRTAVSQCLEPLPANPDWPRYSQRPFPQHRFVPGISQQRPYRDEHSHRQASYPLACPADSWQANATYLYAVDLYNFAYWWECHEQFETLWRAAGRKSEPGHYFQGLIQVAAANLKRFVGLPHAADNLWRRGLEQFNSIPSRYMGLDVLMFSEQVRSYFELSQASPPLIRLVFTDKVPRSDRS